MVNKLADIQTMEQYANMLDDLENRVLPRGGVWSYIFRIVNIKVRSLEIGHWEVKS